MGSGLAARRSKLVHWIIGTATLFALTLGGVAAADHQAGHDSGKDTRSYYVASSRTTQNMQDLGCTVGSAGRNGIMTLFYGAPTESGGVKGVTRFQSGGFTPMTGNVSVSNLTKYFMIGYNQCAPAGKFMYVGVATSNCSLGGGGSGCTGSKTTAWTTAHGTEWANMVNGIGSWISANGYQFKVAVRGAYDAEPSWSSFSKSESWLHGYDSANTYALLANYSADGCTTTWYPSSFTPGTNFTCSNGWTANNLWHHSWSHGFLLVMPQIYSTASGNARQWLRISEYGYHTQSNKIVFQGPLTQNGACADVGCTPGTNNTAAQAWTQLRTEMDKHVHVSQINILYTTDVRWEFLN